MNDGWFDLIKEKQKSGEYDDLLSLGDSLINELTISKSKTQIEDSNDIPLDQISIDMYDKIIVNDEFNKKIKELKKISQSIDKKSAGKILKIDYSKYSIKYDVLLNDRQLSAVSSINGPMLVIAGAGSGKTRVITYRVSFMLENNVDPESILLLTFTRKAANEMIDRVSEILKNNSVKNVFAGTFHSFSNYILRKYSSLIDISPNFSIIDNPDSEDILGLLKSELNLEKKDKLFPNKNRLFEIISKAKNLRLSIKDILNIYYTGLDKFINEIEILHVYYERYKNAQNLLDYDDLMELLCDKLKNNPKFLEIVQSKYRFIMVDEFQDTNLTQKEIVDLLSSKYKNIMVVGDDSQSIYSFRGANYENILRFPEKYKDCKVIKLEQNYRSNQGILNFVNSINSNAKIGYYKSLYSNNEKYWLPKVKKFYSQEDEAIFIADRIIELRNKNISLSEIAVLYRSSFHSNFIEAELLKRGIPYVKYGGIKFAERKHVKDIISYLRIILNPLDAVSWNRILKLIPGIGNVKAGIIVKYINQNKGKIDFSDLNIDSVKDSICELELVLNQLLDETKSILHKISCIKKHYIPILKSENSDWKERSLDIEVLEKLSEKYNDLEKFLSDFALDPPSNQFSSKTTPLINETEDKPLILSTIHSSKGLEWYSVFLCHLLDGLFPTSYSLKNIENLEEERRLFYVACSRAKEELYLTYPSYVNSYKGFINLPSRFIAEIEKKQYEY